MAEQPLATPEPDDEPSPALSESLASLQRRQWIKSLVGSVPLVLTVTAGTAHAQAGSGSADSEEEEEEDEEEGDGEEEEMLDGEGEFDPFNLEGGADDDYYLDLESPGSDLLLE